MNLFIDFLFPKQARTLEIEAMSADKILDILPPAGTTGEKNTLAIFDYSHPLAKEIIWELKYKGNAILAGKLSSIIYDAITEELADLALFQPASWGNGQPIIIMPIPVSDKRRFERGWNQAELLAEKIASRGTQNQFKYLPRQLAKTFHTESQTKTSSRSERLKNITGSMKILHAPAVAGKCVVVIDDVVTTGSTFKEAERALNAAGAKKILCVAVAH